MRGWVCGCAEFVGLLIGWMVRWLVVRGRVGIALFFFFLIDLGQIRSLLIYG